VTLQQQQHSDGSAVSQRQQQHYRGCGGDIILVAVAL
jgi:hypothetical protein